jgi:hypothetical protein
VNWKQLFQAMQRTRGGWLSATSKRFADALNNLFASAHSSRRLKNHFRGQIENLEVRQVLSVTNPLASSVAASRPDVIHSTSNAPQVSQPDENANPTASQSIATPSVVVNQPIQPAMKSQIDHAEDSTTQAGFANNFSTPAMLMAITSGRNPLGISVQADDDISIQLSNNATQSTGQNTPSPSTSSDVATAGLGRAIANNPPVSLNDSTLRNSNPIRDESAAVSTSGLSHSAAASTAMSDATAGTIPQRSGFVPVASTDHALKNDVAVTGPASIICRNATADSDLIKTSSVDSH